MKRHPIIVQTLIIAVAFMVPAILGLPMYWTLLGVPAYVLYGVWRVST